MIELDPYTLDRLTNERIVCTSEYERLDIRRELREVFSEQCIDLRSRYDPLFDQWYESWGCDVLYDDTIIQYMNSLLIHTTPHGCLSSKNSDFCISSLDNCLSSWDRHTENMSTWEYISLEPTKCMD